MTGVQLWPRGGDERGLPPGGVEGMLLAKDSSEDYAAYWADAPVGMPDGGTAGEVLTKSSGTDYDADWAAAASGVSSFRAGGTLLYVSGRYIDGFNHCPSASSSVGVTNDTIILYPIEIYRPVNVNAIACRVEGAGAGGDLVRLGIYNADATTGLPTTVLVDAGTASASSAGVNREMSFTSTPLTAGVYWRALQADGGTMLGVVGSSYPANRNVAGISAPAASPSYSAGLTYVGSTTNVALPDLTGATFGYSSNNQYHIWLKVA